MDTIASLCDRYGVDMDHARHVAALTQHLLEAARAWLPDPDRLIPLGETAALLHNLGMKLDEAHHHTVGRDIVASSEIEGVDATERAMLACAVRFHRKKVDPEAEPLMQALTEAQRHSTLLITAALRVADGLDYHGLQDTRIVALTIDPEAALLRVRGSYCHENAARALAKAAVWNRVLPPLRIEARMDRPGTDGDMPLGEAGRACDAGGWLGRRHVRRVHPGAADRLSPAADRRAGFRSLCAFERYARARGAPA